MTKQYVTIGKKTNLTRTDRGFWFVECPFCKKIHDKVEMNYWNDDGGGYINHHYVVCYETGQTIYLETESPFKLIRTSFFRLHPKENI